MSSQAHQAELLIRSRDLCGTCWAKQLVLSVYFFAVVSSVGFFPAVEAFIPPQAKRCRISNPTPLFVAKSGGRMIVSVEEFAEVVLAEDSPRPILAFFSAAWCGPCRLSVPVVKDIMKQYTGEIDVVEINTDDLAETSAECGVVSIPTIQFYYRGELLDTIVGCVAKSVLSSAVSKVLEDISIDNNFDDSDDAVKKA